MVQDPWNLMFAKRYTEAVEQFSRCVAEGGLPGFGSPESALRGRAQALLLIGRPSEALNDFAKSSK
jgi:hypothetical protein